MNYYCHDNFEKLPATAWQLVLEQTLVIATHMEISRVFAEGQLPQALAAAMVPVPLHIKRPYVATHRFILTPAVIAEVRAKSYNEWNNYEAEDPAFYQEDVLLLGTITHEDYVVMRLSESERMILKNQGIDFWCNWD